LCFCGADSSNSFKMNGLGMPSQFHWQNRRFFIFTPPGGGETVNIDFTAVTHVFVLKKYG
jgi:hypothetical protein